jgi:hypothetical protein
MAGTRTNALVAAGAAAFVMCGLLLDNDPSARGRIVSYIVSGVGFLAQGSSQVWCERAWAQYGCHDLVFRRHRRTLWGSVLFIWRSCLRSRFSSPTWSSGHWPIDFTPSFPKLFLPKRSMS